MDNNYPPEITAVNGINLSNYIPYKRSYNTILYINKKYLKECNTEKPKKEKKEKPKKESKKKEEKSKNKGKKNTVDKSIQFNGDLSKGWNDCKTYKLRLSDDSVLEQTIKFAKSIVPLTIPPSRDTSPPPIFYTIKARKSNKRPRNHEDFERQNAQDVTYKKEKSKQIIETYRNEKVLSQRESLSVKETVSFSSQNNTLDDLRFQSPLCCSLSDESAKHEAKRDKRKKQKQTDLMKFATSESFDALATELVTQTGEAKVKIHLMNDTDKSLFAENIRTPIINAIKECISELNNNNYLHSEVTTVQKFVKCNTQKLDNIIERLSCIEKKIDRSNNKDSEMVNCSKMPVRKPTSMLESLGEDVLEVHENSSEEEMYQENLCERKRARARSAVVQLSSIEMNEEMVNTDNIGDAGPSQREGKSNSNMGQKPDRPNRIPARLCWTDAARK